MKQKKLIFNFFVNRNGKKLTDSRKRAKILADNRKSHHPIETLYPDLGGETTLVWNFGVRSSVILLGNIWRRKMPAIFWGEQIEFVGVIRSFRF